MSNQPEWIITSEELSKQIKSVFLLDVREPEEYEESHIEGCKLIPLDEVSQRAPKELNPELEIVVYCAHGVRSLHALMALKKMGFKKVRSLEGGIVAWQDYQASHS